MLVEIIAIKIEIKNMKTKKLTINYKNMKNYFSYVMELLYITSKCKRVNTAYEHTKQKIYIQNLFTITLVNLIHLDIRFAES